MENSASFLWSAATQLPNSSPSLQLLKAHYAERSIALAKGSCVVPDNNVSSMCSKCSVFWSNGVYKLRLQAAKNPKRRTRNFVIKHYKDKKSIKLRRLSRKLAYKNFQSAVFTCKNCNNIMKIPLMRFANKKVQKEVEKSSHSSTVGKEISAQNSSNVPKRKKKKRDPFAGLSKEVILAVQKKKAQNAEETKSIRGPSIGKLATILKKKASISGNKLDTMLK